MRTILSVFSKLRSRRDGGRHPRGIWLAALASLMPVMHSASHAESSFGGEHAHFVAPGGDDTGPGVWRRPWKTIQHAADVSEPGDTVFVRAGIYRQTITLSRSGSAAGGYITFAAFPGERPIIDVSTVTPPSDTWSAVFLIVNQSYVVIKGFEIRNYVATLPGQEPAGVLIDGYGSHIKILNNRIHHIRVLRQAGGSCDPSSCNGHGIAVYGQDAASSLDHIEIAGNEIYDLKTGWSESLTLDGNVENFRVTGNTIHDNDNIGIDAAGFYGFDPDPVRDQARDGEIRGNRVYNIDTTGNPAYQNPDGTYSRFASGIYVDGGARIVIEQNESHNNDIGIEVASENPGHTSDRVKVRNNLIYHSLNVGIAIGGYDPTVGGTSNTDVVNNTLFENDTLNAGFGEFFVQSHISRCQFKNNLLYATSQGLFISNYVPLDVATMPLAVDYNLYYSPDSAAKSAWMWNNSYYVGYVAYRDATGNDHHATFADPLFVRAEGDRPDLRTRRRSPARAAGVDLGSSVVGEFDYSGHQRTNGTLIDIGAYQGEEDDSTPADSDASFSLTVDADIRKE